MDFIKKAVIFFKNTGIKLTVGFAKIKAMAYDVFQKLSINTKLVHHKIKQDYLQLNFYKLPWYLIIGSKNSGKQSFLNNIKLNYINAQSCCDEAVYLNKNFSDYKWYFSQQAVFIKPKYNIKSEKLSLYENLIKSLKKVHKNKIFSGVILTLTIHDLMSMSNKERNEFIQNVSQYVKIVHKQSGAYVPLYLIFNKCDLLSGFCEFFSELNKEDLQQVWGFTLPLPRCHDQSYVIRYCNKEYTQLTNILKNRVLWTLNKVETARDRALIYQFPQQIQLIKQPIINFISELFLSINQLDTLQFRGLYFTSCNQESGNPYDYLSQAIAKKYQLVLPIFKSQKKISENYFVKNIFLDVIYPEAEWVGENKKYNNNKRRKYQVLRYAQPVILGLLIYSMHQGYQILQIKIHLIENRINYYQHDYTQLAPDNAALIKIVPVINQLYQAYRLSKDNNFIYTTMIFTNYYLEKKLEETLNRALRSLFLPRIASQLKNDLSQNIVDANLLYANLKAYLVFSDNNHVEKNMLKAPMLFQWKNEYIDQINLLKSLEKYLDISLQNRIPKLPIDQLLINKARKQLEQIMPADRAYGLLKIKSNVSNYPNLDLSAMAGENFKKIFSFDVKSIVIPSLYTKQGFENIFSKFNQDITKEVVHDNQIIGLPNNIVQTDHQIKAIIIKKYNHNYIAAWNNALTNISIKPFISLSQSIKKLNMLMDSSSPMNNLLLVIYSNSDNIDHDNHQLSKAFKLINNYYENISTKYTLKETVNVFSKLRDYLLTIEKSKDPQQASFNAILEMIQGKKTPLQLLYQLANNTPTPINQWLTEIADQVWFVILDNAHQKMNEVWQHDVMLYYVENLKSSYPFDTNSINQVPLKDFIAFFGEDGLMSKYYSQYIKPFIDVKSNPWRPYHVDGHTIDLTRESIDQFMQWEKIHTNYFLSGSNQLSVEFSIKPITLSSDATNSILHIGETNLNYRHGPQQTKNISWPLPENANAVSLTLNTFSGDNYHMKFSGPWSIYQFFSQGTLNKTKYQGLYYYDFNLNGVTSSYQISNIAKLSILNLSLFKKFLLPNNITIKKREKHVN